MRTLGLTLTLALLASPLLAADPRAILSWQDNSTDEDGFRVERNVALAGYTALATVPPNVESYVDDPILPATDYCYRVVAFNASGENASAEICGTSPAAPTAPAAPGQLNLVITVVP